MDSYTKTNKHKFVTIATLFWDTEKSVTEYFYNGIGNGYQVECG